MGNIAPPLTAVIVLNILLLEDRDEDALLVERDLKACYELGANSYVVKPVKYEAFNEAMREIAHYWLARNEPPTGLRQ